MKLPRKAGKARNTMPAVARATAARKTNLLLFRSAIFSIPITRSTLAEKANKRLNVVKGKRNASATSGRVVRIQRLASRTIGVLFASAKKLIRKESANGKVLWFFFKDEISPKINSATNINWRLTVTGL